MNRKPRIVPISKRANHILQERFQGESEVRLCFRDGHKVLINSKDGKHFLSIDLKNDPDWLIVL